MVEEVYQGFELGPIRPPSESESLMIRVTRNCPWNQCKFCTLYKGEKFSVRSIEHVKKDIDRVKKCIDAFREADQCTDREQKRAVIQNLRKEMGANGDWAYHTASGWYRSGMKSIFLQDANSLVIKPDDMVEILTYIRSTFGEVERITSYARSSTLARISNEDLKRISDAGLNRIHIGMESAADRVLELVKKGVDKKTHIEAGQKVKKTAIELSEYFMPGLGGIEYSKENALETADALNQINPDFIRIRTLAVTKKSQLYGDYEDGIFTRTNDNQIIEELLLLIRNLKGITSTVKSDHILNLIPEVEGVLPHDQGKMIAAMEWYLDLNNSEQMIFRVGRRTGVMTGIHDLGNKKKRQRVLEIIDQYQITEANIDQIVDELMNQFI